MQLYCREGRVLAWHDDGQLIPADAYGAGVVVQPYGGSLDALGRLGEPPPEGEPDTRPYAAPPISLDEIKASLKAAIDARAEALRGQLVTSGAGQAMEYQEAQAQAAAALKAQTTATSAKYPMLAVTIGIDIDPSTGAPAVDVLGVARSIDAARTQWLAAGVAIRGARLTAKKAIDDAADAPAALAAAAAVEWPAFG